MPYMGAPPFVRDPIDVLIDRRLRLNRGLPPEVEEELNAESPETAFQERKPGLGRQILGNILSQQGLSSIGAGLQASSGAQGFGEGLVRGLGGSLAAGGELSRQAAAAEAEKALQERKFGLEERRVKADELRAGRETRIPETAAQKYAAQLKFYQDAGLGPEEIKGLVQRGGARPGGGGGGRETDLMRGAQALVDTGRAPDLSTGYIMWKSLLQQAQLVGTTEKVEMSEDANGDLIETSRRINVYRRVNPVTGQYETIDEAGNLLQPQDLQTFRSTPAIYGGGSGGPANRRIAPPDSTQGVTPPLELVPSHTPVQTFTQGQGGQDEATIIQLLQDPSQVQDVETLRAYASGQGPAGDSAMIRETALARLRAMGVNR